MPPLVAVLDANVLYPARLRDLLIRLAIAGLYQARWTERILDECFDNLVDDRPDLSEDRIRRTRRLMAIAVPDAVVGGYEGLIAGLELSDRNDRHVLAAAIASGATRLVTANLADFPAPAVPAGIAAVDPDAFVLSLFEADPEAVVAVIDEQAAALRNPPMTTSELLDGLEVVGLRRLADSVRALATVRGWPNGRIPPTCSGRPWATCWLRVRCSWPTFLGLLNGRAGSATCAGRVSRRGLSRRRDRRCPYR